MKGLKVAKHYEHYYYDWRINGNHKYFVEMKENREETAQIYIAYHWRKNWPRLKSRRKPTKKKV